MMRARDSRSAALPDRRAGGTVATVTFDNARRLNVVGPPALLDLKEAFLGLAQEDDLRAVVLGGEEVGAEVLAVFFGHGGELLQAIPPS